MIVAELHITSGNWAASPSTCVAKFSDLAKAVGEFDRVSGLLKAKGDRKNDTPNLVEIEGDGQRFSIPLDSVHSVGLVDLALADEQEKGMRDAFPNIFKR